MLRGRGRPRKTKRKEQNQSSRNRRLATAQKNNQDTAMVENKHNEPVLCEQNTQHRLIIPNIELFTKNSLLIIIANAPQSYVNTEQAIKGESQTKFTVVKDFYIFYTNASKQIRMPPLLWTRG